VVFAFHDREKLGPRATCHAPGFQSGGPWHGPWLRQGRTRPRRSLFGAFGAMSKAAASRYHRLIIKASPHTDIWLADDDGHLVQKECGTLDTSLLPGDYVVEFGLGTQTYPIHLRKDSEYSQAEIQTGPSCPRPEVKLSPPYTAKQGQYLAFIYYFMKIHGEPPSEAEMQRYFRVTPPSVHQMVLALQSKGLIERTPGKGRSIRLLVDRAELPDLE